MIKNKLLAGTALALVLGATPLLAQSQPGEGKSGSAPSAQPSGGAAEKSDQGAAQGAKDKGAAKGASDGAKGSAQKDTAPADKGGKAAQKDQSPVKGSTGAADKDQPSGKAASGSPEKDKSGKSAAQKDSDPKAGDKQGTAQKDTSGAPKKADAPAEKATPKGADKAAGPGDADRKAADKSGDKAGSGERVQLTEEKRTRVREVFTRQNVERETNININVSIGTRVPRSVRLYPVPAAVIEIVPEYRNYRYVVIRDEICIVDPATYEIIVVVDRSSTTAGRGSGGVSGSAVTLTLNEEQRSTILRNVDIRNSKRLGIGSVTVGVDVPRSAELVEFPSVVVERVPEVREYRYFVHEDDIAVVNPRDSKVVLVIEGKR